MHPWYHSLSSARKHGGEPESYMSLHSWFDASKELMCDFRHRALRHHAQGIFEAERVFGTTVVNSLGKLIPVRILGEQHVREDLGRVPTLSEWLRTIKGESWMYRNVDRQQEE